MKKGFSQEHNLYVYKYVYVYSHMIIYIHLYIVVIFKKQKQDFAITSIAHQEIFYVFHSGNNFTCFSIGSSFSHFSK